MRIRKIATLAVAIAMPLSAIGTIAAAELASAGAPLDTGSITCVGTHTATLSPAFHFGGTTVTKSLTTLSAGTDTCTGNTPVSVTTPTVKIQKKYAKPGTLVADCSNLAGSTIAPFTLKVKWSDKTKSVIAMAGGGQNGAGFKTTGTVTSGSFAGETVSIQSDLSVADIVAITACSTGGAPVTALHLTSTISVPGI
jgi:hypothetical protein